MVVAAAASLTDAFGEIAAAYEAAHPGVDVELNFAGSSALREQILEGAPIDVFASANADTMQTVVDAGLVAGEGAQAFATNSLAMVVPTGNPGDVSGIDDFERSDLLLGLCAPGVPCGDFAREALDRAGVVPSIDTEEPDVRALLAKVSAGELDAGIVYRTDVQGADVEAIPIPEAFDVVATYAIAALADSVDDATAFIEFVMSEDGQEILAGYGFGRP